MLTADPALMSAYTYTAPQRSSTLARGGMVMDEIDAWAYLELFDATHYGWFMDEDCKGN